VVGARPAEPRDDAAVATLRRLAVDDALAKRGGERFVATDVVEPGHAGRHELVGTIGDDVVGFAGVVRDGSRALLVELFTHPDARGVGVGHALLVAVQDLARSWGCTDLDSWALPGDRDTKNFFESHAMKSRLLTVHTSL